MMAESLPPTASVWYYEYEHNNTGCPEFDAPQVTIYSITLIICLLGLVGNGIVLWFLGFCMKRNAFTIYVLKLAIADTGFLLCSAVLLVAYTMGYLFCDNPESIYILFLFTMLYVWTYSISLYLLMAVSVLYPIWHRCHRPRHLSAIVSALLWALSCLLCCSMGVFCLDVTSERCIASLLPIFVLNVLIFTPVMVLSSLTLFIKVRRSSQRCLPGKLDAVILLTILFFLLFTVSQSVEIFLTYLDISQPTNMLYVLAYASSSINPFIYFVVGSCGKRRFCGSLKLALQRVFER